MNTEEKWCRFGQTLAGLSGGFGIFSLSIALNGALGTLGSNVVGVIGAAMVAAAPSIWGMARRDLEMARRERALENQKLRENLGELASQVFSEWDSEDREIALLPVFGESTVSFMEALEEMSTDALRTQYFNSEKEAEIELRLG